MNPNDRKVTIIDEFSNRQMEQPGSTVPLKISIIGAGIGGLTASIALRRQGHDVQVGSCAPATAVRIS